MFFEDMSLVIKFYFLVDKMSILFSFEWDNIVIRVFFGVICFFREIVFVLM